MNNIDLSTELDLLRKASEAAAELAQRVSEERARILSERTAIGALCLTSTDAAAAAYEPDGNYRASDGEWETTGMLAVLLDAPDGIKEAGQLRTAVRDWAAFRARFAANLTSIGASRRG